MKKLLLLLLVAATSYAETRAPQYYRVLVPVISRQPVPGAFGSLWTTPFALHNPTSTTFYIDKCAGRTGGCLTYLDANAEIKPGETETSLPPIYIDVDQLLPARVLYITTLPNTPSDAAQLSFQLRSADISRSATNAGTEIPVVRENQFRTAKLNLLNVPVDPRFRLTLRLYEMNERAADFRVNVYDQETGAKIGTTNLRLEMAELTGVHEPGYAQIGDLSTLAGSGATLPAHLRIEIEPLTANSAFWGFVSITNNDTQHVTLVTPQ
jgi:hypothetical protein